MLSRNLNLGKYKQYVQKTLIWRTAANLSNTVCCWEKNCFCESSTQWLIYRIGGMGVECKALCIMGEKSYLRSLEMPALKETQTAWTSYKRCIQI